MIIVYIPFKMTNHKKVEKTVLKQLMSAERDGKLTRDSLKRIAKQLLKDCDSEHSESSSSSSTYMDSHTDAPTHHPHHGHHGHHHHDSSSSSSSSSSSTSVHKTCPPVDECPFVDDCADYNCNCAVECDDVTCPPEQTSPPPTL